MNDSAQGRGPIDPSQQARDFEEALALVIAGGVPIPDQVREKLMAYGELVIDRSAVYNLISPADRSRFFTRHVSESLCHPLVEHATREGSLVDIGSGAGLPGIPLSILIPQLRTLLVEPRQRKAQFLEMAVFKLGISDRVEIFQGTAESLGRRSAEALNAGLATARSVSRIGSVWAWSQNLLRPGGWMATYKAPTEAEQEAATLVNPTPGRVEYHPVPGASRTLLLVQRPLSG